MKAKRSFILLLALVLTFSLFLAACGEKDASGDQGKQGETKGGEAKGGTKDSGKDDKGTTADAPEGGTLVTAVDNKFEGLFEYAFSGSATDAEVISIINENLLKVDDELKYQPHIAEWETKDNKVYTFKFKEGVKWHNGEELTVEDWKYALEVIAHKDYDGPRFKNVEKIEGVPAYHKGKAKDISGIKVLGDYEIEITFDKARVNNVENVWTHPMPRKHYEGIAVKDLSKSKQVRTEPVGLGPFKVKKIVPAEYVEMERFDDYWQGKPKLDKLIMKVVDPAVTVGALKNKEIDYMDIRPNQIKELEGNDHIEIIEYPEVTYSYVAFKLGHWDKKNEKAVMDNPKFQDKRLRQAMFYALDRESIIKAFLDGKAKVINTPIPSNHWVSADEKELTQYTYDPEKAKQLLKEAGFKDVDGDGFVEDPDGKKFTINFDHYDGPGTFEGRAKAIIQNWRDIGLDVKLNGGLKEFNLYNDLIDEDEPSIEVFFGSWSTAADPDPSGIWKSTAFWNRGRWVNEKSDQLLEDALSEKAFDQDYRIKTYVEWQKLFNEELPALPVWENIGIMAKNKRVGGLHKGLGSDVEKHKWHLTDGK